MKHPRTAIVVTLLIIYLAGFYIIFARDGIGQPLVNKAWQQLNRLLVLLPLLFRPEESLLPTWFGDIVRFPLADRLPIVTLAGVVLAWAAAAGWLILELFGIRRRLDRLEGWIFSLAVGLNLLSTWTLLLGLLGILSRGWLCLLPATLTFAAAALVWYRRYYSTGLPASSAHDYLSIGGSGDTGPDFSLRWLWAGVPFLAMILLAAVLPPLDFDVKEYHLQAPKEFFQQGQVTFLAHNVYANMAMGTEMLSLLSMVLTGDWWIGALVGKTVVASFTPLCAVALFAAGRRWHSVQVGVIAAIVFVSTPAIVGVSSTGLVEGGSACYLFLAVYALLLSDEKLGSKFLPLALSGYLAGAAVATKYPAVLFVLAPLAVWTFLKKVRYPRPALKAVSVFLLATSVGCGLWFGKNWWLTGNPSYPLLYSVFGGKTWSGEKDARWNAAHRPQDYSGTTLVTDTGRVALTSIGLSPLLVPLAVLAFFGSRRRDTRTSVRQHGKTERLASTVDTGPLASNVVRSKTVVFQLLAYSVFVIAVWWLFTHRIDRFWVPILPVIALLAGIGARWTEERWWRRVLVGMLAIGLISNFLIAAASPANAWFVPLDQLRENPRWINPWHWYFNNDPEAGRVLAVGDAAVFDLATTPLYSTCFDDCPFEQLVRGKTVEQVRAAFAENKIGYVFVNWSEIERYRSTYGFTDFVQPEVFQWLVEEGVLQPIEPLKDRFQQAYRVVQRAKKMPN